MKKLLLFTIVIVGISFAAVEWKFKSKPANLQTAGSEQAQSQSQPDTQDQTGDQTKKLVVSDEELAKLQAANLVSSDTKYYIKQASPIPKLVDLETGNEYVIRPSASYSKLTKLSWAPDGKTLVYIYQVPDEMYVGVDILNTITVSEIVNQKFVNAARVLVAAPKLDYVWLDSKRVLYSELQNFDSDKKFYRNGTIGVYNLSTEGFEYPLQSDISLDNLYSISLASGAKKFLYTQAKLDDTGATVGQQYVVASLDGTVVSTTSTYNPNWSK